MPQARTRALATLLRGGIALAAQFMALFGSAAQAGSLDRAAVEALFPPPLVVGERGTSLPVWPVFRRAGAQLELQAHVFETIDLEPVSGYGGKPSNLLVVMDRDGSFRDVRLLSHSEPIFKSEAGSATLNNFAAQYKGLSLNHSIQVLGPKAQRVQTETTATLHGVLAGTVSALAIDKSILESAAQVAQARLREARGEAADAAPTALRGPNDRYRKSGFNALASAKLVQPILLSNRQVEAAFKGTPGASRDAEGTIRPEVAAIDAWVVLPGLPQAGRNLLDPTGWMQVRQLREDGVDTLLLLDGGRYRFAAASAPEQPRAATLSLRQGERGFALREQPYEHGLALSGQRSGVAVDAAVRLFAIAPAADGTRLDILQPLTLAVSVLRGSDEAAQRAVASFEQRFEIPGAADYQPAREWPAWMAAWSQRGSDLLILGLGLLMLTIVLLRQRWLAASTRRLAVFRAAYLVFTLGFVGWWAQGQLTILSLTSAIEAGVAGRSLDFLLADPMAVVLWAFTGITLLVWGRGTFCGWLCPFGALQELAAMIVQRLGLRRFKLRRALDQRLKLVKYALLSMIVGASVVSAAVTEQIVEIEPFKTSITMYFQRDWPYLLWAIGCIGIGVLVHRGYCRYVCPLGAALAIAGRLRVWGWIPRRAECGSPCQTCRHRCEYQAIEPAGKVQYDECFQCLDCVEIHEDAAVCLPLVREQRARVIPIVSLPVSLPASILGATS